MTNRPAKVVLLSDVRGTDRHDTELYMPLSTMAIGTVLAAEGHRVTLVDAQVETGWRDRVRQEIVDADWFGVSSLTGPSILAVLDGIEIARQVRPAIPVVWGGYHASQAYASILDEGLADFVVRGAGEPTAIALTRAIVAGQKSSRDVLGDIPNLAFVSDRSLTVTSTEYIGDMNRLPPMNYDLIDVRRYFGRDRRSIEYISSYGCPYQCAFCVEPNHTFRRWKGLQSERVVNEIETLYRQYQPDLIGFQDPNFSTDPRRVVEIVEEMKRRDLQIPISTDMRARDVGRLASLMDLRDFRRVGFINLFMGLESGSDRMLTILRKGSTAAHAREAGRLLGEAGIVFCASFIHDLPGETEEDSDETFRLIADLAQYPTNRQLHHFYMPYPSTELGDRVLAQRPRRPRTQREWADTSTYLFKNDEYGRPDFRRRVLHRLIKMQRQYPSAIHPSTLPMLGFGNFEVEPSDGGTFWGQYRAPEIGPLARSGL